MVKSKVKKNVENNVDSHSSLTKLEEEIYGYIIKGFRPQQIMIMRKKKGILSKEATYRPLRNLRGKGYLSNDYRIVEKLGGTQQHSQQLQHQLRLHGQQFSINILYKDHRYMKFLDKCNSRIINNQHIMFYKDKIVVYGTESFFGEDVHKCMSQSMKYWNKFIRILENDYQLILLKPRSNNIKFFNQHWAEVGNELANEYNDNCEKLRVYGADDGKLWLLVDNSFNMHELEATHPIKSPVDITKVRNVFNDIRDKDSPLPSVAYEQFTTLLNIVEQMGNQNRIQQTQIQTSIELHNNLIKTLTPKQDTNISSGELKLGDLNMYM